MKSPSIYGIEIIESLAEKSKKYLQKYEKVKVYVKDGSSGLKEKAPFDRILISAAASKMPEHLYDQLKDGGVMVTPVEGSIFQIKKVKGKAVVREFPGFVFVPLVRG